MCIRDSDYTKGIRHRLKAYEELLADKTIAPPDVTLMQVSTPSRERVDAYIHLREEIERTVGAINGEYSDIGSPAVHYFYQSYPHAEMAAMFLAADVLIVTPLRDGMNLVAKEYVASRHDLGGALVLSEFTGAWDELHQAFICNPHDVEGVKQTIMRAITAPQDERRRRMKALRERVADHDVQRWASLFLESLASAPEEPHRPTRASDEEMRGVERANRSNLSGGRGESHPPAPTDPGVRVSPHRALVILVLRIRRTTPTGRKASGTDGLPAASTPWPSGAPAAADTSCGAGASSSH